MNNDRKALAWLGIAVSLLCCLPLACITGFTSIAGGVSYFDTTSAWESADSVLFTCIVVILVAAVAAGLFLTIWGVWTLLNQGSNDTTEPIS
jgi:hypothetical protein